MKRFLFFFLAVPVLAAFASFAANSAETLTLPPETGLFRPGTGSEIANSQCLVCHSVEYVTTQPKLARTFWKSSIDKMRLKFGANVPADQIPPLLDYLVAEYGKADGASTPVLAAQAASGPAAESDPRSIMTRHGCFNCHQTEVKLVGPPLRQVAAKYSQDPGGVARIMEQIKNGGGGKWGPIPMPPAPGLSPSEMEEIARWILALKP